MATDTDYGVYEGPIGNFRKHVPVACSTNAATSSHAITLDLDLPDSSGFHTLERMRAAAAGPVVVISGNGHPMLVEEALKRRAYDVIPKHELDAATLRRVLRLATLHHEAGRAQRATEGRFRALLENSAEALVLFDAAGRIEYASASMYRVLGHEPSAVVGRNGLAFVLEEDRELVQAAFPRLVANPGASVTMRVRFMHKDGGARVLESTLVNRLGDPDVVAIVCSFRDLTQEEEQRARFDATFENAAVGLAHVDLEGRVLLANRRLADTFGYAPGELVGRTIRELSHPEDIDATAPERAQLSSGAIPQFTKRKRYLRKDGDVFWAQLTVTLERDARGAPLYEIAAIEDVTGVVRADEKLRASEARLRAIVDAEPECVKVLDGEGTLLDMNPAGLAMIEADDLETVAGQCVYGLVAPASRQAFRELTERACRGERGTLEFEVTGLKGARRWLETHAVPLGDESDGRKLMLGITRDITDRKRAERRGERLSRMYAALSATNEAILKAQDARTLYQHVCELMVEHGGIKLAAVRLVDPATKWIEAVAHAGAPLSYLEKARVSVDPALPHAQGPAALAVREGRTVVNNDYLADPSLALWHAVARESGIASTMSVPLRRGGAVVGLITLYAAEPGWFGPELVGLAERMVQNVSFALDSLDRDAALRESEQRFRSLTELGSDWFWEQDAEYRFTRFDGGQGNEKWGGDQSRSIGLRRWEIPGLAPLGTTWEEHRALLDARQPFRGFEYMRVLEDGSRRYVAASGTPVFGAGGRFLGYRGTASDITARKAAEQRVRLEHRVAQRLAEAGNVHAGLAAVIRDICESEGWDCGRYFEADEAAGVLRFGDAWGVEDAEVQRFLEASRPMVQPRGAGIAGEVWQSGAPLWVADIRKDARVSALGLAINGEMRGAFVFPVTLRSQVLGVLSIAGRNVREPDQALLGTMRTIGNQVGQFLSRQRGEAALRESEARFRGLTELSSDYYWETDPEHILSVRGAGGRGVAQSTFGPGGGVGHRRWELPFLTPDMEGWMAHKAVLDAREPFHAFEFSRPAEGGGERFFSISGGPAYDAQGLFLGYRGVGTDITERKLAERRMRLEHEVLQALAAAADARAGIEGAIRVVCEAESWDCGRYFEADAQAGLLRFAASWSVEDPEVRGFVQATRGMTHRPGEGVRGIVWQTGEAAWVADARVDPRVSAQALATLGEIRGALVVPVTAGAAILGVLSISSRVMRKPDERLLRAMRVIGSQLGQFLSRMRAEGAMRESESRFRGLTEMSSDFYWETDAAHRFTLRGAGARQTAVPSFRDGNMLGKARWELPYLKPDLAGWMAHKAVLDAHQPFRDFEFSRLGVDGDERTILISGAPVFDAQGAFAGYRGVGTDVSEKKQAQQTLELEHAVVRHLAEADSAEAGLQAVMRSTCELSGWESGRFWQADEAAGVLRFGGSWARPGAESDAARAESLASTFAPGAGLAGRVWQSGQPLWIADASADERVQRRALAARAGMRSVFLFPVISESRALGVLAFANREMRRPEPRLLKAVGVIGSQIGQFLSRMRAEQATRESEERFRNLTELSSDWYWEQDADFRFTKIGVDPASSVYASDADVLGKTRWELPLTPLSITWEQHRETLRAHRTFREFEYSHAGRDGGLRYFSASGYPVHDAEGRFQGYRGIAKDITPRQRAREELRASHERFEIVSRATNDVVWDWNLDSDEVWWNDNFQAQFGYAPEEIGAHSDSWTSRIHPEDRATVKAKVDAAIATGAKAWSGEYRFRRKDGSYADVYDRGLLMHDAGGRAVRVIGAMMDISERKHAEGRMRVYGERQAAVARFGQFALGRRSVEELYTEAAHALHCEGVDAVCLLEMYTERREYLVRAARGEGPHASIGLTGPMAPDSVWPEILRENAPRIAGRKYLAERPLDRPWRAWLRGMGSAVYAPVRDDDKPIAMLCMYAVQEHAFGAEDARFAEAVSHVLSTALQRQKAEERLARMAQFDALTGLPNRTLLQDRLGQTIVQSRRRQLHAGVLFVDLDRFKLVNDTLGHHQGDALIRQVGQRLLACVRPGDTVGRISGDEFAVVLADMARPDDAALVGQKILEALAVPFDLGGNEAFVTGSIGIAVYPGDGGDAETLLKNADMAMYRAKESARNSYCFFTAEMNQRSVAKVQLNADLRHALERAEFALHYQPKVDLATGALRGLEALLRWNHPARGMVSPLEFVPALEDSGLIIPVGEWVITEACAQIRRWQGAGLAPVPVAVNLSAKQFLRRDLDGTIQRALAAAGVPAKLLELEITESSLMDNPEEAVRAMNALRTAGLKISVDDFGTGYSSLAYLARFPLSALKIDRAFVQNVHKGASDAAIVRAVIDMANNLGLQVIAEGVETEAQADFLRRHGCHQAQGYLYSRPLPAGEIAARLPAA